MKRTAYIMIVALMGIGLATAEQPPEIFKDSEIKRVLKDGSVQKFGDDFMIVPREKKVQKKEKKKAPKPVIVYKERVVKEKLKKNSLKLLGGYGPSEIKSSGKRAELDSDPFLGVGYQRRLSEDFSVEVIGTTKEDVMIGGGFHW